MPETQTYKNHVRWYPLVHFVMLPMLLVNFLWAVVRVVQDVTWDRLEFLFLSIALIILGIVARTQALSAQDRVIRLEERLRYKNILSPETAVRASDIKIRQIIALRFAPDEELPRLVDKVLAGELKTVKDIKLAVKNWRGDHHRV